MHRRKYNTIWTTEQQKTKTWATLNFIPENGFSMGTLGNYNNYY